MELEDTMASLRINEAASFENESSESESEEELESAVQKKRRVSSKPIKLSKCSSLNSIENYYLDKRVKRLHPSLETIYEDSRNEEVVMSTRKFSRAINFNAIASRNDLKVKKRKLKAKHVTANKRVINKKISIKYLIEKLAEIKDE